MREKDLVNKIMQYLKAVPELFCWKEHGGQFGTAGIPDIIICYRGKFVALEVKTENGKVSVLQEITLRKIRNAGGAALVVKSVDEVKKIIGALSRE
jgi:hypothetical protein